MIEELRQARNILGLAQEEHNAKWGQGGDGRDELFIVTWHHPHMLVVH